MAGGSRTIILWSQGPQPPGRRGGGERFLKTPEVGGGWGGRGPPKSPSGFLVGPVGKILSSRAFPEIFFGPGPGGKCRGVGVLFLEALPPRGRATTIRGKRRSALEDNTRGKKVWYHRGGAAEKEWANFSGGGGTAPPPRW